MLCDTCAKSDIFGDVSPSFLALGMKTRSFR